eukprot:2797276-Rhodomonas_salina.1
MHRARRPRAPGPEPEAHATASAFVLHAPVLLPMSRAVPAVPCSMPSGCMPCMFSLHSLQPSGFRVKCQSLSGSCVPSPGVGMCGDRYRSAGGA